MKWIYARTSGQMFLLFLSLWAVLYLALFLALGLSSGWDAGSWLTVGAPSTSFELSFLVSLALVWRRRVARRR
ncbi:hypothetical protein [Peterkaempfera griseoplana]|uniref:hypothetical protein n=1 Tax=Peterkaempfera griseoplana TaxID=66896 RepID=UPI0012FF3E84|nr:hypothetical protein [Peterkaempfera griseoplana]